MIRWDDDSSEMMIAVAFFPETKEKIALLDHIQIMRRQLTISERRIMKLPAPM